MHIESYVFGRIVINGTIYTSDIIIYPGRVDPTWRRKEGHRLGPGDLIEALKAEPDVLIIGTGYAGVMRVPQETVDSISAHGIAVRVERTSRAVEIYNELQATGQVIASLHLTC
jgi:hypothetical protein